MAGAGKKKRYESPLRQAQARSTRMMILDAARQLFAERGYVATSVDDIATAAGVGRATVFASVGGKPALLKQAYDVSIVGDDAPVALAERPRTHKVLADPDPYSVLAGYAEFATEMMARVSGIYGAVRAASGADSEAKALWTEVLRQRRAGMDNLVKGLTSKGPLRAGLSPETAADIAWALVDPWFYEMFVRERGWTPEEYRVWLTETLQAQLLPERTKPQHLARRASAT
jgi:AcrR family transcriptional regulator